MVWRDHKLSPQNETKFTFGKFQRRASVSLWRKVLLFSAAYFVCAEAGNLLSPRNGAFVSFWMPAGLYLAVLLLNPTRDWPWLALAVLPANLAFDLFHGTRFPVIIVFFCANTLQAVTGAWLVRRFVAEKPALASLKEFIGLAGFAGIFSPLIGAVIGAAALTVSGMSHSFAQSWKVWWGSNVLAVLLFTPFILAWFSHSDTKANLPWPPKKRAELAALFLGLTAFIICLLVQDKGIMSTNRAFGVPLLLWAGLRFGPRIGTATSLYLALPIAFFTSRYFVGLSPEQVATGSYIFGLQVVLAMANLVALIPAIVLSERDQTMAKLRDSENRFRSLTEAAFEGVCISEAGKILDMNDQGLKMFGWTRDEIIGKEIIEVVAPESRAIVSEAVRTGRESVYGHKLLRKDGTFFYAEAQARMVRAGGRALRMTALRDITERKMAEQALRESEEKFSKAFRTSPDVMSITDFETGCYLEVNDAHEKTFGFKREEVIGRSPLELGILEDPSVREKMLKQLKAGGSIRDVEIQTRTRDGGELTLLHSAELIELGGRMCVVRVSHDITDRKRAEAERTEALSREAQARAEYTLQLIASQEAERTRIAGELHDSLGQTLSIIKNQAQLALLRKDPAGNTREQLEAIRDTTSQAIAEMRRISHDLHPYQLDHLGLTRALDALIDSADAASGTAFKKKFDATDDAFSRDAATNLYRIVQEGVNNILKYSRAGNARITLERDVHEVQLTIEDDGCGFKAGASGKGMGLKNIAERARILGGRMKLDSAPGKGTRLEITIPIPAGPE